jgi:hypothetical protein
VAATRGALEARAVKAAPVIGDVAGLANASIREIDQEPRRMPIGPASSGDANV